MVVRKISEMYDLRTSLGRLGLIGIHTPTSGQIARRWAGDMLNHRFFRILKCNIRMACASMLPADPLQVGVKAGSIAPQDLMNPILYRAVTNESWNSLVSRLYGSGADVDTNSVKAINDAFPGMTDADVEDMYYSLLSSQGWRKALPQSGLTMYNLRPFVYPIFGVFGTGEVVNVNGGATPAPNAILGSNINGSGSVSVAVDGSNPNTDRIMRGPARPYPRMVCSVDEITFDTNGGILNNPQTPARSYVCAIALPPGKLQNFYFRLIVDWFVEFSEPVSILDKLNALDQASDGQYTYNRGYSFASSKELVDGNEVSSVSAVGADVDLVMEQ